MCTTGPARVLIGEQIEVDIKRCVRNAPGPVSTQAALAKAKAAYEASLAALPADSENNDKRVAALGAPVCTSRRRA
jgi:hypothetical protein